jgi:hypothetical protein
MQLEPQKNFHAAELGSRGGQKRMEQLSAQERSALAKYAARSLWHPREAQEAREKAQEITYLIKQALKDGKQLPLVCDQQLTLAMRASSHCPNSLSLF